jgi:hypothetical protein
MDNMNLYIYALVVQGKTRVLHARKVHVSMGKLEKEASVTAYVIPLYEINLNVLAIPVTRNVHSPDI